MLSKNQFEIAQQEIKIAIKYARNRALANNIPLTLTPLQDSSSDWAKGVILFVDNKSHKLGQKDKIIHQWQWQQRGLKITWHGFRSNRYIIFSPQLRHAAANGSFELVDRNGYSVTLNLNRLGRLD